LLNIDMQFDQLRKSDDRIAALVTNVSRALELLRSIVNDCEQAQHKSLRRESGEHVDTYSTDPEWVLVEDIASDAREAIAALERAATAPERCAHRWQRTSRDGLYRCRDCGEEQADMGGGAPASGLPEGWEVSDAIVTDGKNWAKVTALGYLQVDGMVPTSAVRALLNNYGGGQ
jgi:hypothetical protein